MLPRHSFLRTHITTRLSHSLKSQPRFRGRPSRLLWAAAPVAVGGATYLYAQSPVVLNTDNIEAVDHASRRNQKPMSSLLRSYAVYSMCGIPLLVDWAPSILAVLFAIPGIGSVTDAVVRRTFFRQFVGGESAHETIAVLEELRSEHKCAMLSYSVEVDLSQAVKEENLSTQLTSKEDLPHKLIVEELIRSVDAAADFEDEAMKSDPGVSRRTSVALKLTALVPSADSLKRFSDALTNGRSLRAPLPGISTSVELDRLASNTTESSSDLTASDLRDLRELRDDLIRICGRAKERGIRVMIDAEYSWYQPAIDAYAMSLMRTFNQTQNKTFMPKSLPLGRVPLLSPRAKSSSSNIQPVVYTTFQAYLRRTPLFLEAALRDAERCGYALGIKLVRGAYHPYEIEYHHQHATPASDPLPPVWSIKSDTDACYNHCAGLIVDAVSKSIHGKGVEVGVLFGTHNWDSAKGVFKTLHDHGLAQVVPSNASDGETSYAVDEGVVQRVVVAQLFGMCESLTSYLVDHIVCRTPMIAKCVPYGVLADVMPYLGRRAIENKAILGGPGGAGEERKRVGREIWSRIFG